MMRYFLTAMLVLTGNTYAQAQTCTPVPFDYLRSAPMGGDVIPPRGTSVDFVPDGEVWLIRNGGIGAHTYGGGPVEYALQIERAVYWTDGTYAGTWLTPLEEMQYRNGTPMRTINPAARLILMPKERLSARANKPPANLDMYLMFVGWKFPEACLPRLLGVEDPVVIQANSGGVPPPNFAPVVAELQNVATALQALAAAIPKL